MMVEFMIIIIKDAFFFIEHLLVARNCSKSFMQSHVKSQDSPGRWGLLLASFHKGGNSGLERLTDFCQATQQVRELIFQLHSQVKAVFCQKGQLWTKRVSIVMGVIFKSNVLDCLVNIFLDIIEFRRGISFRKEGVLRGSHPSNRPYCKLHSRTPTHHIPVDY